MIDIVAVDGRCPHCGAKARKQRKPASVITTTSAGTFRDCNCRYFWRYEKGLQPKSQAEVLRFGSLVHEALAAVWLRKPVAFAAEADPFDIAKARALLIGYCERWGEQLDNYEVEAIEQPFDMPLTRGWRLQGKRDGIVRPTGRRLVLEHKTSASDIGPGSDYMARLSIDTQCSLYMMQGGFDGVLYDVIKKPSIRPYQAGKKREQPETADEYFNRCVEAIAEAPEAHYQRVEVVRLDGELESAKADLIATVNAIDLCRKRGVWAKNDHNCFSFGSRCAYWQLCSHTGSESEYAVSTEQHPELKEGQ